MLKKIFNKIDVALDFKFTNCFEDMYTVNEIVKTVKTSASILPKVSEKGWLTLTQGRNEKKKRQENPRQQLSVCAFWNLNDHRWDEREDMGQKAKTPSKARGKNNPASDSERSVMYS